MSSSVSSMRATPRERPEECLLVALVLGFAGGYTDAYTSFAQVARDPQIGLLRKSWIYMGVCAMFGTGAAAGAFLTERVQTLTLMVPIAALLLVPLLCARSRPVEVARG
jgi:uncharacterized membrane protein YoaK (UPF0700 family)